MPAGSVGAACPHHGVDGNQRAMCKASTRPYVASPRVPDGRMLPGSATSSTSANRSRAAANTSARAGGVPASGGNTGPGVDAARPARRASPATTARCGPATARESPALMDQRIGEQPHQIAVRPAGVVDDHQQPAGASSGNAPASAWGSRRTGPGRGPAGLARQSGEARGEPGLACPPGPCSSMTDIAVSRPSRQVARSASS